MNLQDLYNNYLNSNYLDPMALNQQEDEFVANVEQQVFNTNVQMPTQQDFGVFPVAPQMVAPIQYEIMPEQMAPVSPDQSEMPVEAQMPTGETAPAVRQPEMVFDTNVQIPEQAIPEGAQGMVTTVPQSQVVTRSITAQPNRFGFDQNAYNAEIARRETGNRPEFANSYHYPIDPKTGRRRSTSYGLYGITAPTYARIQQMDPYFANRPITSLSVEEQTRANNVLTNALGDELERNGIPALYGNLQAAHFLGVPDLVNYFKTGQIRPEVAAANGGEAKTRKIIEQRISSNPPQPQAPLAAPPMVEREMPRVVELLQNNDTQGLFRTATDPNANPVDRRIAAVEVKDQIETQMAIQDATNRISDAEADPAKATDLTRDLAKERQEGSWLRALFLQRMGFTKAAEAELDKLGYGPSEWRPMNIDGKNYTIKVSSNGRILRAFDEQGRLLDNKTTAKLQTQAITVGAKIEQSAKTFSDPTGSVKGSFVLERGGRRPVYREIGSGRVATDDESRMLQPDTEGRSLTSKARTEILKAKSDLDKRLANREITQEQYNNELSRRTTEINQMFNLAGETAVTMPAGAAAGGIPVAGAAGAAAGGIPVAGAAGISAKQAQELAVEQTKGRDKYINENLVPAANTANTASNNIKQQLTIFDNPESDMLFGVMNKAESMIGSGDRRWAIVRDVLAGKISKSPEELSKDIAQLDLTSQEIGLLQQYNALNGPLVAASARQLGGAQLSDADRAAAEKLQVDITRTPAIGAYNIKSQQLFGFDLTRYKSDWAANQTTTNVAELEKLWRKEESRLVQLYGNVSEERMKWIKNNSGGQPPSIRLVREAFKRYPVPQYDPNLNNGNGGWRNLRDRKLEDIFKR